MIAVAAVAVYLAILTSPIGFLAGLATPVIGALIDLRMKGPGVVGGMLGGVVGTWGVGATMRIWEPIYPTPNYSVTFLDLVNAFLALGVFGLVSGAFVGIFVWAVATIRIWLPVGPIRKSPSNGARLCDYPG
jgi:hypothetical protein